ncbi:MAG: hypothetical protein HWD86_07150 [Kangiellaceae bacterium]|nr:hypothetical protein [Kangiellaceae bacterium]
MNTLKKILSMTLLVVATTFATASYADLPTTDENGVTRIHLDQYGGYFDAKETLASLKAGTYEFVVTNKTNKVVGFQIQNYKTHEQLDKFPLEPNQTRISRVEITEDGFRYRCPINPTPWYDVEGVSKK